MAKNKKAKATTASSHLDAVTDYRFPEATRKNNPPAKIAAEGHVPLVPKAKYAYSPRRPPELRFDPTGRAELLAIARQRKLTEDEARSLAEALRMHEPWPIVNCPREMSGVRLAIGSNAASVWWVNGKEVIGIYGDRQTVIDDGVSKRITLQKGPNVVRAAVVNGGGATDFCARFLDADDNPIKGITVTLSEVRK